MSKQPIILIILDGWGYRPDIQYNAIAQANPAHWNTWWHTQPHALLEASGYAVGLPKGQMGNSEVGHMHIGSGRIIPQDLTRIDEAIQDGTFSENHAINTMLTRLEDSHKTCHVIGLLSDGGVHSHESHLYAFLEHCRARSYHHIALHLILDGRDTPPQSAQIYLQRLMSVLKTLPEVKIHSMTGRYYAMDRDQRFDRLEPFYDVLTTEPPHTMTTQDPFEILQQAYAQGLTDEFLPPTRLGPYPCLQDHDAIFCFNFRSDRVRQLTEAFISPIFKGFTRQKHPTLSSFVSMTRYADHLPTDIAFPPLSSFPTLGEILSEHHHAQLRLAETEKYAHVTFFLNGGEERVFPYETRCLIPSPHVKTYDLQPEMSAWPLTEALIEAIDSERYQVIICNYANADMVGHTGDFKATEQAIQTLDQALNKVHEACRKVNAHLLITADHGNAECMFDESTQQPHTAHTSEPVPFVYLGDTHWTIRKPHGSLIDIAPTILHLLGITIPPHMTGTSLLKKIGD